MNDVNLAGYLVGIGIHHKDGTETYKKLDKPIHNRIVKTGINQILMYNGTPTGGAYYNNLNDVTYPQDVMPETTWYPIFRGNLNDHYGCLHFCQYGTDNTPTKFFQTELNSPYPDKNTYTSTIKENEPYTCTYSDDWNQVSIYITHQHAPVTETVTVREIAWFGRCKRDTIVEYLMFSRVALDEGITLQKGEYLFNTYKLVCTVDKEEHDISDFGGIVGQHAYYRYCPFFADIHAYIENHENVYFIKDNIKYLKRGTFGFPGILKNGRTYYPIRTVPAYQDDKYIHTQRYFMFPQVYMRYGSTNTNYNETNCTNINQVCRNTFENVILGTNPNTVFPNYNDVRQSNNLPTDTTINPNRYNENAYHTFVDYDTNKNYRDIKLILPKYNHNLNFVNNESLTIHYLRARGYDYKLGYYTWNEDHTEQTWNPQPIVKKVNEEITFTVRTTISTDDTEDWQNGRIVEGNE